MESTNLIGILGIKDNGGITVFMATGNCLGMVISFFRGSSKMV